MKPIFRFFASNSMLSHLFVIIALIMGAHAYFGINRTLLPMISTGEVGVYTYLPGAGPEDVELNITNRIEEELQAVPNVQRITSTSVEGRSSILIKLEPHLKDLDESVAAIRDAVGRITNFPPEVTQRPRITEFKTSLMPIIEVAVVGEASYEDIRATAKQVQDILGDSFGVGHITPYGYYAKEVEIALKPEAIRKYQIAMVEIIRAIERRNIRSAGGTFESFTSEKSLVTIGQFETPSSVEDVIVRTSFEGPKVRVRDLAVVKEKFSAPSLINRLNGVGAVSFQIAKKEGADIFETVDDINRRIKLLNQNLPDNIQVVTVADLSRFVRNRFDVVQSNGIMGLLLVFLILSVFLNFRTAFWVAAGIPICLAGVFILLNAVGYELDVISLSGFIIVLGILVDDAIIVAESIYRRFELGDSPVDAAVNGLAAVFRPVVTTLITTFFAFAPMFYIPGVTGQFVQVIPLVITMALLASAVELIIALPAHLVPGMAKQVRHEPSPFDAKPKKTWFDPLRRLCVIVVTLALKLRYLVVTACIALAGWWFYYAANHMEVILFPSSVADEFHLMFEMPNGSSLEATSEKLKEFEAIVATLPDVERSDFIARAGRWGVDFATDGERYGTVQVILTPYSQRERTADQIIAELRPLTNKVEGVTRVAYHVKTGGPPVGPPVKLSIVASDDDARVKLTEEIVSFMRTLPGATDVSHDMEPGKKQVQIRLDYDRLAELGLTVADIAQNVRIAYDGQNVTNIRYRDEDVAFKVILEGSARRDLDYLKRLLIPNRDGRLIPLKQIAKLEFTESPAAVHHFKGKRSHTVTANVDSEMATPLELLTMVKERFSNLRGYGDARLVIEGEAVETEKSLFDLSVTLIAASIAIYFMLIILFNSLIQPLLVMSTIPFGAAAVIQTFALHDEPIGFLALLGLVGLSGVVVNDSLVLVSHINGLRQRHTGIRTIHLIAEGTSERLRAIVLTTVTTAVGLIPLAYGWGGSDPFMAPMALAMGYGLLLVTPLTLVLVPCLYTITIDLESFISRFRPPKASSQPNE